MKKSVFPAANLRDGQLLVVANDIPGKNGVYYSNGKEWKKLTDVFKSDSFNIISDADRKLAFDISGVSKRKTRKIIMPDKDIDLEKLFNTDDWNKGDQFSWTHVQSTESLTIPERRDMISSELLIDGELTINGNLSII